MEIAVLDQANYIYSEIDKLKNNISRTQTQKCEFIFFSYGNGSSREVVCDDLEIIEKVRAIILSHNNAKLDKLLLEFKNL